MISLVVPTLGRPSLYVLLDAVPADLPVIVVDDRPDRTSPLSVPAHVTVIPGPARGPAAARNAGWRASRHEWVAFLDDDVLPDPDWAARLAADLDRAGPEVGGVQGRLRVPLPAGRAPTDWERVTAGLADGAWITADMAYRWAALAGAGGFDERLPRAFREDAELAFRVRQAGWRLQVGDRWITHPVRPESRWVSLRTQRGNADDALLRRLYGPYWRSLLEIPPGRRHRHAAITGLALTALVTGAAAVCSGRRLWALATVAAAAGWTAGTAEFAVARIAPGPRVPHEVITMLATSVVIPPVAVVHWWRGWWRWRNLAPARMGAARPESDPTSAASSGPGPESGARTARADRVGRATR